MTLNQMQVERVPNQAELVARAEALLPGLHERARVAEESRRLSDDTVREFRAAEFHKILQPRRFGGFELGFRHSCGGHSYASNCLRLQRLGGQPVHCA